METDHTHTKLAAALQAAADTVSDAKATNIDGVNNLLSNLGAKLAEAAKALED